MSVTIQDNFSTAAAKPTDARYGPYNNVAAAQSAIPEVYRYKGLTVGILNSGVVEEYWWANGVTNPDLVQKTATGNVTGITQGTGIIVDNTNPQIPDISVDTSYVQVVSNLSTSVPTDGTSDIKYPSVKAVKDYADGLVVGLLNDRGNWAAGASPGPYPSNPPATGSGPLGAILKGDIWFISTNGFLGTTAVSIGASVRALVDSPNPSTDADWDIIDAGLGFTPENITNKVSTGANVNADPTSTVKYPSVRALVEYVQTYTPAPTTPDLQAVTNVGASTTNSIAAQAFGFYDSSTTNYAELLCTSTGVVTVKDSLGNQRLSLDKAGTDLTVWANYGSTQAILDFASVSGTKIYTFPNATGTIALTSDLSSYVPYTGATTTVNLGEQTLGCIDNTTQIFSTISYNGIVKANNVLSTVYSVDETSFESGFYGAILNPSTKGFNIKATSTGGSFKFFQGSLTTNSIELKNPNTITGNTVITVPNTTGTMVLSVNGYTSSTGQVTIPDATTSVAGLVSTGTQTFSGSKTFQNNADGAGVLIVNNSTNGGFTGTTYYQGATYRGHIGYPNTGGTSGFGGKGLFQVASTFQDLVFSASPSATFSEKMRITTSGNVGIGTTSPSYKLDVNGSIRTASGSGITCGGTISLEGSAFFNNTTSPGSTSPGYDAIHSGGSLVATNYNGLYTKKQDAGYYYTLLEFPAASGSGTTINARYRFPSLGASNGYVPAMTDGNASSANNYIIKAISSTGQISKSNIYEDPTTANIGIGTSTPDASAILELNSTTKGFRLPRMGTGGLPSPAVKGLMVHADADNDAGRPVGGVFVYDNSKWNNIPYRSYLVYTAIINQSGTNAPTVVATLENNIGTISFSRTSAGVYLISSTNFNGFTSANKVVVFVTNGQSTTGIYKAQYVPPTSAVQLESLNLSGVSADSLINNMSIEIRMYI